MPDNSQIWIECKSDVMVGKPCVKGTRITVESILQMLSAGMTYTEIINDYPSLDETKIRAAIGYAATHLSKGNAA
ncbi:DUF433 domain-containing protein [Microbulbifer sp. 2304DJ12-6]|uniref:DUF433 domain-containing protein n=1 Tax=Microbulbifer spongiae TaxID=2944933 RepID=A0ABY9EE02_9GAMM|nr:DUF433 domain-containing protein [Microbulbifer sp. MI-G]WKD50606.1 DUF433 domain-containing protein [Microbulbifer sp. MI-G]